MAKKQTDVFTRAAAAIETGTSAQCAALIAELRLLEQAERPDMDATRPPEAAYQRDGSGRVVNQYQTEAGRRYRAAALSDDPSELQAVMAEHARLSERASEIDRLRHRLQARQKTAAETEKRAAAPAKAKALVSDLDGLLDRAEAAMAEFADTRAEIETALRDLVALRALDDSIPALSMEAFYRAGQITAHRLHRPTENRGDSDQGFRGPSVQPLFGSSEHALALSRSLLPGPAPTIVERIRQLAARVTGTDTDAHRDRELSDSALRSRLTDWHRARVDLLHRGEFDAADKLGAPEYTIGSRGRPQFGDAA